MTKRGSTFPYVAGGRHSADWYDASGEEAPVQSGDRFFVMCEGGPCTSRLEVYPPRIEIEERDGTYVLDDDGPRDQWRYVFMPNTP